MSDDIKTNLAEMADRVAEYAINGDLKPCFPNTSRAETHEAPADWFKSTHRFVLDWYREGDGWLVQCAFNLLPSFANNHYVIWIYDWRGKRLFHFITASHTVYPPVWDRGFGGLDYADYVSIQHKVKRIMDGRGIPGFEVDETLEGKWVFMTKEKPDEIRALLAEGKPYTILCIKAEAAQKSLKVQSVTPIPRMSHSYIKHGAPRASDAQCI